MMLLTKLYKRYEEFKSNYGTESGSNTHRGSPYGERLLQIDEIRLLTIKHDAGAFRLHITPHKLQDDLEYDAISYVWGAAEASINVSCNGTDLAVTPTVFEMLQHLNPSRPCWLDSICINQQDSEEKAIQIPLMYRIYSRAAVVVIWMGMPTVQSEKFMANFPGLLEKERKWTSMVAQNLQPWIQEPNLVVTDEENLSGLIPLLTHQWFQRLWTFQEFVLAKRPILLHGRFWIRFYELLEFVDDGWFKYSGYLRIFLPETEQDVIPKKAWQHFRALTLCGLNITSSGVIPPSQIPYLLYILRDQKVKEPVDRAWAITGLLSQDIRSELNPLVDYSDNGRANPWRTYLGFARTIMVTGQSLSLLKIPRTIVRRPNSIPSWCPSLEGKSECAMIISGNWNYPIRGSEIESLLEETADEGSQSALSSAPSDQSVPHGSGKFISFGEDDDYMQTRGHIVDTLSEVIEDPNLVGRTFDYIDAGDHPMQNPEHAAKIDFYIRSIDLARRIAHDTSDDIDSNHGIPPEYLMTLLCDTRISRDAAIAYKDMWTFFVDGDNVDFEGLPAERKSRASLCYDRLISLTGHSFFSTTGGRLGIATPGCKPGDKVCAFYGEPPLHILRWPESGSETGVIHGDGPAEFCGVAFIPHLMKPHEQEAARLGPDEIFVIG